MATIIEAILTQIFEVVWLGLGYSTGIVLVRLLSFGRLHVQDTKDEPLELYGSKKASGWHIVYVENGRRYVVDWFVCLLGIFFWIGLIFVVSEFI